MEDQERIHTLNIENFIWLIYVAFAFFGIKANNLEIEDIKNNSNRNRKKYKGINITIFIISLFIYIYFINLSLKNYRKRPTRGRLYILIGTIFVLIGGIFLLLAEISDNEDVVPNEI